MAAKNPGSVRILTHQVSLGSPQSCGHPTSCLQVKDMRLANKENRTAKATVSAKPTAGQKKAPASSVASSTVPVLGTSTAQTARDSKTDRAVGGEDREEQPQATKLDLSPFSSSHT